MDISITYSGNSICAIYKYKNAHRIAICDMSEIQKDIWYVNRVNVPLEKSSGIGSLLIQESIKYLKDNTSATMIIVEPGGYSEDLNRQINFYAKNGFIFNDKSGIYTIR